jgi:hypothetical protein
MALRPGRQDPFGLLTVWFLRKSVYWLFGLGLLVGASSGHVEQVDDSFTSASELRDGLFSSMGLVVFAIVLRIVVSQVALLLAFPLAKQYDERQEPRTGFGSSIGTWLDRLKVARAFRSLRWTHHVRQTALRRLGPTGDRLGRLDPVLDVANITLLIAGILALLIWGASTAA